MRIRGLVYHISILVYHRRACMRLRTWTAHAHGHAPSPTPGVRRSRGALGTPALDRADSTLDELRATSSSRRRAQFSEAAGVGSRRALDRDTRVTVYTGRRADRYREGTGKVQGSIHGPARVAPRGPPPAGPRTSWPQAQRRRLESSARLSAVWPRGARFFYARGYPPSSD